MYKIKVFSIGKTKELWMQQGLEEYANRLKATLAFEWHLVRQNDQLLSLLQKETHYICLDPNGKSFSSKAFSLFLQKQLEKRGSRLSFVIGGAEGLPNQIKKEKGCELVSLSPLTFTHQLTRLILVEQIYRALEIAKGSSYHK